MTRKMTFSEFCDRASKVHCGSYSYVESSFTDGSGRFTGVCKDHGQFTQRVNDHLNGSGCQKCAAESQKVHAQSRVQKHLEDVRKVNPQYDYSKFESTFTKVSEKVTVLCREHGEFSMTVAHLKKGKGCRQCGLEKARQTRLITVDEFMKRAKEVHGEIYSYKLDTYIAYSEKMTITCSVHGDFQQSPLQHVQLKHGCSKCASAANSAKASRTVESFEKEAKELHKGLYSYTGDFSGTIKSVTVICEKHGKFSQLAYVHLRGAGCPVCARESNSESSAISWSEFLERVMEIHGEEYTYFPEGYKNLNSYVKIICKTHGEFLQKAGVHLRGSRCQSCAGTISKGQVELLKFVKDLGFEDAVADYRYGDSKREFDVFIPSKMLALEYDGTYFHSSKFRKDDYHLSKQKEAEEAGVELLQIFSDQWETAKEQVKQLIASRLGRSALPKVFARNCEISEISDTDAKNFHNANHVQGWKRNGENLGLIYNGKLVAVMTFTNVSSARGREASEGEYELARYSTACRVVGGASKLFNYFVKSRKAKFVLSYSDTRLFSGAMYEKLGFNKDGVTRPSYTYWVNGSPTRLHKSHFRHSNLRQVLGDSYNPALTERENCENAGHYQVYDCGLIRWNWKLKD